MLEGDLAIIVDLGFSKDVSEAAGIAQTRIGTPITMAPELLRGEFMYNAYQADVYSLGVIFFYMLYGQYPYYAINHIGLLRQIEKNLLTVDTNSKKIDQDIKDLVMQMLEQDSKNRITFKQIYQHRIF